MRGIIAVLFLATSMTYGAQAAEIETVVVTGRRSSEDTCLKIAAAKFAQWDSTRLKIEQTRTFANGSAQSSTTVFTQNMVYGERGEGNWNSIQIVQRQRRVASPESVEKNMGLVDCRVGAQVDEAGQPTTIYTYSYAPDSVGNQAKGQIWITDSTGLPFRQELWEQTSPSDTKIATKVTAQYFYGDDVKVPLAAENADAVRRGRAAQWLRDLQLGRPSWGP